MGLFYRTEDIRPDEVQQYFVETQQDRQLIAALKQQSPVVLVGSRGAGKSFLLRMVQLELQNAIATEKVLPVYVTFNRSSLLQTNDEEQFKNWMLARLCHFLIRVIEKSGLAITTPKSIATIAGGSLPGPTGITRVQEIMDAFEQSWKKPGGSVDISGLPTIDHLLEAVEDFCDTAGLRRIKFLIDEAAHVLLPAQQRQFFTLFRDLRSPYLSCNAAVYPGLTSYGDTFQPSHDATLLTLDRDILSPDYVDKMREIVERQAAKNDDHALLRNISKNLENFSALAYAANGNPRILLKTVTSADKLSSTEVNKVVREYYRQDIWSDHSSLAETFAGHRSYVDWGRRFIEDRLLPELKKKNDAYLLTDRSTSCFFWVHRDAPQAVKEALRLLAYTGIVYEHSAGIRATRAEIGTRYAVNLGCLLALEATPSITAVGIAKTLTPRRMTEFGPNHAAFQDIIQAAANFIPPTPSDILSTQLDRSIDVLDIADWQKDGLRQIGSKTLRDVLSGTEETYKRIYMVGEKRSRRIRNAAEEAVFEYLSG